MLILFGKYGVKVKTREQLINEGIEGLNPFEGPSLYFIDKSKKLKPVVSFDNQQNIKGVIEAYRDYLIQTNAGKSEVEAWENTTREFYNVDPTKGQPFKTEGEIKINK